MRVRVIADYSGKPSDFPDWAFNPKNDTWLQMGATYHVYAMMYYWTDRLGNVGPRVLSYLVALGDGPFLPHLAPMFLFEVVENRIPEGWVVGTFDGCVIMGPPFIADSYDTYANLMEGEPCARRKFQLCCHDQRQKEKETDKYLDL